MESEALIMIDLKKLNKAIDTIQQDKKTTTFCINMPTSLRDKIVKYSKTKKVSASMMIKTVFSELVENQSRVILYGVMDRVATNLTPKIG